MNTTYCCKHPARREGIERLKTLNGIDRIEVVDGEESAPEEKQRLLRIRFILPPAATLKDRFFVEKEKNAPFVRVAGGIRIAGVATDWAQWVDDHLEVHVTPRGDFSPYTLRLVEPGTDELLKELDPRLAEIEFSFKVECPSEFDCLPETVGLLEKRAEPEIDYLAKDYAGFRRLMLDRLSAIMPDWRERNPADLQVALVELLAYAGDHLSYFQDAAATEAYLGTARKRVSLRRHARLLDYAMHEGCNARAWVCLTVSQDIERANPTDPVPVPRTAKFLTTAEPPPNGPEQCAAWLRRAQPVFEPLHEMHGLYQAHNRISLYTWSDEQCCLRRRATRATLQDHDDPDKRLRLRAGDVLVLEEIAAPESGIEGTGDRQHRHAVRLTHVDPEASEDTDDDGVITRTPGSVKTDSLTGQPIVEVEWDAEDALPFALCLSALIKNKATGNEELIETGVARGNVVLVSHGLTLANEPLVPEKAPAVGAYRPALALGPLTFQAPLDATPPPSATATLRCNPHDALPCVELTLQPPGQRPPWRPQRDLLASGKSSEEFVVEMESDGVAHLRFGDDTLGQKPKEDAVFRATYRVGNGPSGNIGAETIRQVLGAAKAIGRVWNPLPAEGGAAPEAFEQVRQFAPQAFRRQERAVTAADYAAMAERHPGIQKAAAQFRWTGSWFTAFVAVDRKGGLEVDEEFKQKIHRHLELYRLAGYDVEIQGAETVPLDVAMTVCVKPGYFRAKVKKALLDAFSNRDLPDGRRGFFHPDNFTFGQPVYLSALYGTAMDVTGVASVEITSFQRWGQSAGTELDDGVLKPGQFQIIRLDNDRNFPEYGKIEITMEGGL